MYTSVYSCGYVLVCACMWRPKIYVRDNLILSFTLFVELGSLQIQSSPICYFFLARLFWRPWPLTLETGITDGSLHPPGIFHGSWKSELQSSWLHGKYFNYGSSLQPPPFLKRLYVYTHCGKGGFHNGILIRLYHRLWPYFPFWLSCVTLLLVTDSPSYTFISCACMYVCTCIDRKSKPYIWENIRYICLLESDLACLVGGGISSKTEKEWKKGELAPEKVKLSQVCSKTHPKMCWSTVPEPGRWEPRMTVNT